MKKSLIICIILLSVLVPLFLIYFPIIPLSSSHIWELEGKSKNISEEIRVYAYIDSSSARSPILISPPITIEINSLNGYNQPKSIIINNITIKQNKKNIADIFSVNKIIIENRKIALIKYLNENEMKLFYESGYIELNKFVKNDDIEMSDKYIVSDKTMIDGYVLYLNFDRTQISNNKITISVNFEYIDEKDNNFKKELILSYKRKNDSSKMSVSTFILLIIIAKMLSQN